MVMNTESKEKKGLLIYLIELYEGKIKDLSSKYDLDYSDEEEEYDRIKDAYEILIDDLKEELKNID